MAIDKVPLVGRRGAVERQFADDCVIAEAFDGELPTGGEDAERDRQIERGGVLREIGRSEIDHYAILRPLIAAIHQRPFDAVYTLFNGRLGEADEDGLRERGVRDVDLDFDRKRVNAQQREGLQLGEHRSPRKRRERNCLAKHSWAK